MTLFLCNWYKREELAVRISFLFSKQHCRTYKKSPWVGVTNYIRSRVSSLRSIWRLAGVGYAQYEWNGWYAGLAVVRLFSPLEEKKTDGGAALLSIRTDPQT